MRRAHVVTSMRARGDPGPATPHAQRLAGTPRASPGTCATWACPLRGNRSSRSAQPGSQHVWVRPHLHRKVRRARLGVHPGLANRRTQAPRRRGRARRGLPLSPPVGGQGHLCLETGNQPRGSLFYPPLDIYRRLNVDPQTIEPSAPSTRTSSPKISGRLRLYSQELSSTVTLSALKFAVTRSSLPSRFRSPSTTDTASAPVV